MSIFFGVFTVALTKDIRSHDVLHHMCPDERLKDAFKWTGIWVAISVLFGLFTWAVMGAQSASLYATGYLLEKSLALDNLFAFMAIFSSFGLMSKEKEELQYKILHWGILGAIVFRAIFLGTGSFFASLPTTNFFGLSPIDINVVFIIFALIILYTVKEMWGDAFGDEDEEEDVDYTKHWSVNFVKKFYPVEPSVDSGKFFVIKPREGSIHGTVMWATPLFLCLICIEVCDILFAFDSMPVIVAVVQDPNIMITSSLMACAGLRALYFALIALKDKYCHLDKAVIALLLFVVLKLLMSSVGIHVDNVIGLIVIGFTVTAGIVASLVWPDHAES